VNDSKQEPLEQRAQALLQASAEQLDGRTRSRLTQARYAALDTIKHRQPNTWYWLVPAGGAAAAAVIAVLLAVDPTRLTDPEMPDVEPAIASTVDELEIVTAEDSLEFYRDVEFYAWLAEQDEQGDVALPESEV